MDLPEDTRVREALAHAMRSLVSRARLSSEIRSDLLRREYSEPEIEDVLSFLLRHRLLNDEKTIQSLIESKSGRGSMGKGKIHAELMRRGVPDEVIESALESRTDEVELEAIRKALQTKRWPPGSRNRAARFLLSRGFDVDLIETSLNGFFGPEERDAQ